MNNQGPKSSAYEAARQKGQMWPMKTSNQAAKCSIDDLQKAHGPLMSPCHPCDLQTPLPELGAPAWRSGTARGPLITLVGVLTTINPLLRRLCVVEKVKPGPVSTSLHVAAQ